METKYVVYMMKPAVAGEGSFANKLMAFDSEKSAKEWIDNYNLNSRLPRTFELRKEVNGVVVEVNGSPVPKIDDAAR